MTAQEFSNEFDVLYNNIMSNQAPGLDEYEKSVFLTKALNELVKDYFNPKGNKYQEGFDGNQKRQIDFSTLLRVESATQLTNVSDVFDRRSKVFTYPSEAWIAVNEAIEDKRLTYQVVPISYSEYLRLMSKPYKLPVKNLAWRLFNRNTKVSKPGELNTTVESQRIKLNNNTSKIINLSIEASNEATKEDLPEIRIGDSVIDIVITLKTNESSSEWANLHMNPSNLNTYNSTFTKMVGPLESITWPTFTPSTPKNYLKGLIDPAQITVGTVSEIIGKFVGDISYKIRYIKKPSPIVLVNLDGDLSVDGLNKTSECELPEEIHPEILQRAVELAKAAYTGDINSTIEMGKRSE